MNQACDEKTATTNFVATEMIKGKRSRGKQREKMLDGLTKLLKVGRVTEALKMTRIDMRGRS